MTQPPLIRYAWKMKEGITGRELIQRLQKAYGLLDDLVSDPNCPVFLMGIYLDKGVPVIQVEGDTVLIRQELEEKLESDAFRLELTGGSVFSQKRLQMLQDEMRYYRLRCRSTSFIGEFDCKYARKAKGISGKNYRFACTGV